MKKILIQLIAILCIVGMAPLVFPEDIYVVIKGRDDGKRTTQKQDYAEALMNAKLQAVERAGIEITSITKVENFQLRSDMIESKAKAVLLPGFQVIDIGYQADGTYLVVLSGKIRTQLPVGGKDLLESKAYEALKRLQSKTETGINYQTYLSTLADVKFEVEKYLESEQAKSNDLLTQQFKLIMSHYENAREAWRWKMRTRYGAIGKFPPEGSRSLRNEVGSEEYNRQKGMNEEIDFILSTYPEAGKLQAEGGARIGLEMLSIDLSAVIGIIFEKASADIKKLKDLQKK
jgi:uncharacterized protein YxeA